MSDLQSLSLSLEDYKNANGSYPALAAGSYITGLSTSRWPSWQSTLGNSLGQTLKTDPVNAFSGCPAEFDQGPCWQEPTKTFQCQSASHIYAYNSTAGGYELLANLEYDGPGAWRQTEAAIGDICNGRSGNSSCQCFNYKRP